jgi:chromatin assembly factor 1 subunit B
MLSASVLKVSIHAHHMPPFRDDSDPVRADPVLASAGDDGVVCIWVPSEKDKDNPAFGESSDHAEDKEFWRVKHLCRAGNGSEIYDLVWSPDGTYILTGSMDNIARIYDSRDGSICFHEPL